MATATAQGELREGEVVVGEVPWHETKLLPREILDNSPSKQEGVDPETETMHRAFGEKQA